MTSLLCFFFLFIVIFNSFFIIIVFEENKNLKIALATPTGTPIALVKEIIGVLQLVADKISKALSK